MCYIHVELVGRLRAYIAPVSYLHACCVMICFEGSYILAAVRSASVRKPIHVQACQGLPRECRRRHDAGAIPPCVSLGLRNTCSYVKMLCVC